MSDLVIYTIGHSNHSIDRFLELLHQYKIDAVYDVRSHPYSKRFEHFSQNILRGTLEANNIKYQLLGEELGGRSDDPTFLHDGKVSYELLARRKEFKQGIDYVLKNIARLKIVLMCSEGDPLQCHRTILIARYLAKENISIEHILRDGSAQNQKECEERLLHVFNQVSPNLFAQSKQERIEEVYIQQGEKIAYSKRP